MYAVSTSPSFSTAAGLSGVAPAPPARSHRRRARGLRGFGGLDVKDIVRNRLGTDLPDTASMAPGKAYVVGYEVEGRGDALVQGIAGFRAGLEQRGLRVLGVDYDTSYDSGRNLTTGKFYYVVTPKGGGQGILPVIIAVALITLYVAQYVAGQHFGYKRGFVAEAFVDTIGAAAEGTREMGKAAGSVVWKIALPLVAVLGAIGLVVYFNKDAITGAARAARPI